jgi:3-oxoacyl-[acyl-carrier protein] reductase
MKVALVTGGSRGIGRAIVEELAQAGYKVAFTFAQRAESAATLAEAFGNSVMACQADVRDWDRTQQVVESVQQAFGPIGVLVNNAGIRRDGAFVNMTPDIWREVLDTNLTGAFNYTRTVLRDMMRRGGAIVNVASVSGITGMAGQANYSASKAGMIGLTKSLSREVARFGVRVNAVAPGFIETDMTLSLDENTRKKLYSQIPAGKPGGASQVAKLVAFLASDDAAYITGQVLPIDGGLS